jgi:phosphatidylinositol 3-kinase
LERLVNKYERGQIQHVDWLDRLSFSAMEKAKEKECEQKANLYPSLVVELCSFEHRVVFQVNCLTLLYIYVMVSLCGKMTILSVKSYLLVFLCTR